MDASFGMIIAEMKTEETLREHKKKAQECVKQQKETRKVITKDGVLKAGEDAERIRCRHQEKVRQAKLQSVLKEKRGMRGWINNNWKI